MIATLKKGRRAGDVMGSDQVADGEVPPESHIHSHAHRSLVRKQVLVTGNLWHVILWKNGSPEWVATYVGGTYVNGHLVGENWWGNN